MIVDSLPDRRLTAAEGDALRQHDRVDKLASTQDRYNRIDSLLLLADGTLSQILYTDSHGWRCINQWDDVGPADFERIIRELAAETGADLSERDQAGRERRLDR